MTEPVAFESIIIVYDEYHDPQLCLRKEEIVGFAPSCGSLSIILRSAPAVTIELRDPQTKISELISELGWA